VNLLPKSLFLKILLWFWATIVLTAFSIALTLILQPGGVPSQWHDALTDTAEYAGATIVQEFEHSGAHGASDYLFERARTTHLEACLLHLDGAVILGKGCERFAAAAHSAAVNRKPELTLQHGLATVAVDQPRPHGCPSITMVWAGQKNAGPVAANNRAELLA
jgi:two-component system sensor histidine kinase CpxA